MQNDASLGIGQHNVSPIIRLTAVSLHGELREDRLRHSELLQCLIDQMGSEVEPEARTRPGRPPPALAYCWTVTVHVGFEQRNFAQPARGDDRARGENFAVPSPI